MSESIKTSDIIFPFLSTNFSTTLSDLKRSTLNIGNRLRSISEDAEFVRAVADVYGLPLVANERCGSWYIPPDRKAESAYFKSTDGHTGQWSFSLRRLNIQVLDVIEANQGCIIVDSTRRGKSMPDALSKTVPIWCAVLNRVIFPNKQDSHHLLAPPECVSDSERAQIEGRLSRFADQLRSLQVDEQQLRQRLSRPLRPFWITRESGVPASALDITEFYPIVLCTASRRVSGAEMSENGYIQGAGDDNEGWSRGLTPPHFWKNKETLMNVAEQDLSDIIARILGQDQDATNDTCHALIAPTEWLSIASLSALDNLAQNQYSHLLICGEYPLVKTKFAKNQTYLRCRTGKLGSRDLRKELHKARSLNSHLTPDDKILVACPDGKDIAVGIALAVLCLHADDNGNFLEYAATSVPFNKELIRRRLSWIMTSMPSAKPSRATLQSVHDFLLSPQSASNGPINGDPAESIANQHSPDGTFSQLSGEWNMHRKITNFLQTEFAGNISGSATFQPRTPTSDEAKLEYLYSESGVFETALGAKMDVRRRWIWRLSGHGAISIHFVKADEESEDYLYHVLAIQESSCDDGGNEVLKACADHLCEADFYKSFYEFYTPAKRLSNFIVKHEVKGPAKDYISETRYSRNGVT